MSVRKCERCGDVPVEVVATVRDGIGYKFHICRSCVKAYNRPSWFNGRMYILEVVS